MSRLRATEPVEVRIGDCQCDGAHPDGDKAWLRPLIRADAAYAAVALLRASDISPDERAKAICPVFLGEVVKWNLLDDDGKPIPCDVDLMLSGSLDWQDTIKPIADAATDLYLPQVYRSPLVNGTPRPSPVGPMAGSISPTSASI